jgi:hypothetical protein
MTDVVTEGGCLCGAVRYRAHGQPTNSMICHCQTCRKAAGAPVVAWLTFPLGRFSFVRSTPAEFRSSPPVYYAPSAPPVAHRSRICMLTARQKLM